MRLLRVLLDQLNRFSYSKESENLLDFFGTISPPPSHKKKTPEYQYHWRCSQDDSLTNSPKKKSRLPQHFSRLMERTPGPGSQMCPRWRWVGDGRGLLEL